MIGLSSTRVVVIDDNKDEAIPIIKALSKRNIATAFFDGSQAEFPEKENRLYGIRLAILDMDLIGGVNAKSKASALVNTLGKILSPDNGPYIVIAWTMHPDLLEVFEKYVFAENYVPNPISSIMMKKVDCLDDNGNWDIDFISEVLENKLADFSPLLILQAWEEQSFLAATEVINLLSQLAIPENTEDLDEWRQSWKNQLLELMHVIADAGAGKKLRDLSSLRVVYDVLSPLQADRLESNSGKLSKELDKLGKYIISAAKILDNDGRAKLNKMFHLSTDHLENLAPGNIYLINPYKKRPYWVPPRHHLFSDLLQKQQNPLYQLDKNTKARLRQILVEITPACDHSQKNIRLARLIPGFLVPVGLKNHFKSAGFIYKFGPCYLNLKMRVDSNRYYLFFSARHMFSASIRQLETLDPICRLRPQSFDKLVTWFSGHATRPGIIILQPQEE